MTDNIFNAENFLQNLQIICGIKDKESKYVYMNQYGLDIYQYAGMQDIIGKTDFELPCSDYADIFLYQDKIAIQGESKFYVDRTVRTDNKSIIVLHKKTPYLKSGIIEGVMYAGFELNRNNYKDMLFSLAAVNLNFADFLHLEMKNKEFEYQEIAFTKRQAQIISYLLRGNTAESTAKHLYRSKRTIEKHIAQICEKLECETKKQLVDKAFELGFIDLMFMKIV